MYYLPDAVLKTRYHKEHFIAEAIRAECMTLVQIGLWGFCLGALPWLGMALAGWTGSEVNLAGAMTALLAGLVPLVVRFRRVIRHGVHQYHSYAGYRTARDIWAAPR